jgi:hypothetical protein
MSANVNYQLLVLAGANRDHSSLFRFSVPLLLTGHLHLFESASVGFRS